MLTLSGAFYGKVMAFTMEFNRASINLRLFESWVNKSLFLFHNKDQSRLKHINAC